MIKFPDSPSVRHLISTQKIGAKFYAQDGSPLLFAYLAYFGALFFVITGWRQADPLAAHAASASGASRSASFGRMQSTGCGRFRSRGNDGRCHHFDLGSTGESLDARARSWPRGNLARSRNPWVSLVHF